MNKKIYKQELKDWNRNAQFYALEAASPFKKILREEMIEKFHLNPTHKKILDLGAGVADFASFLEKKLSAQVICIDFSAAMKKEALKEHSELFYYLTSAAKLPFNDSLFDAVVAVGILHHLKIQDILSESIAEIDRVLKPGGYFCYLDRSNSFIAAFYESLLSLIKNLFLKIKKEYSASSTTSEISLTSKDTFLLRKKFQPIACSSIYSMPFKFLMVMSNFLLYVLGEKFYLGFQKLFFLLAIIFEKYLNFKFWETEYCEVLKKN